MAMLPGRGQCADTGAAADLLGPEEAHHPEAV